MGQNRKKLRKNSHLIIHFPTSSGVSKVSERSGARERSEQYGASERVSGASERANGRVGGPVLTSAFLIILAHSAQREGDMNLEGDGIFEGKEGFQAERAHRTAPGESQIHFITD